MKAGDRVLDVCCGTGDQAVYYAQKNITATGVDRSPNMIKIAEIKKSKLGLSNVSFQIADALDLPFHDSLFDYASICLGLHEKERVARNIIISEMKRVVRKGGALVFTDFQVPLPQRPIAYLTKTIEFIGGRDHFRYFRDYIAQGGMTEILKINQLGEEKRDYLKNGLMVIIKASNT
ncbi:MAG: methyltransferase domain-containing protein [Dehalococcoidia bacterium]|nr:MAG: methyltransferase domain-containing protein [Dehalococcoidia bacterium]